MSGVDAVADGRGWTTELDVVDILVEAGLIPADRLVDEALTMESGLRRNRNLRMYWRDGTGYFVKLPDDRSPMSRSTIRAEASFYRTAMTVDALRELTAPLVHFDKARDILVLQLMSRHHTLQDRLRSAPHGTFPISAFGRTAAQLARIHSLAEEMPGLRAAPSTAPVPPYTRPDTWVLQFATPATLEVLKLLQDLPAANRGIADLAASWEALTLVHGDVRPENVLLAPTRGAIEDLRLIDWELCHLGDPAQDIGQLIAAAISSTLGQAVSSATRLDLAGQFSGDLAEAGVVLQAICSAILASYSGALSLPAAPHLFVRALRYAALRLVQGVVEMADKNDMVLASGTAMLELAGNVFADPERAAARLLVA